MKYLKLFEAFNEAEHPLVGRTRDNTPLNDDQKQWLNDKQAKLDATKDLWDVDVMGSQIENDLGNLRNLGKVYDMYHFEMVPAWIRKHWGKDMTFKKENLFDFLYKKWEPKFKQFLKDRGLDSQECFVSYEVGSNADEPTDNYYTGYFKMGFDVWEEAADKKDAKSGWALFTFTENSYFRPDDIKVIEGNDADSRRNSYLRDRSEISAVIGLGQGTFYTFKTEAPYKGLHDYFGDGGYILRLD